MLREMSPPSTSHVSHVMCHMSHITCHMSQATGHMQKHLLLVSCSVSVVVIHSPAHHVNKPSPAVHYVWFGWYWGLGRFPYGHMSRFFIKCQSQSVEGLLSMGPTTSSFLKLIRLVTI